MARTFGHKMASMGISLYGSEVRDGVAEFMGSWDLEVNKVHDQKRNSLFFIVVME